MAAELLPKTGLLRQEQPTKVLNNLMQKVLTPNGISKEVKIIITIINKTVSILPENLIKSQKT